jgi:hypothetical protein
VNLFNILPLIAAVIIIVFNKPLLNIAEKKSKKEGKPFDKQNAFILSMCAVAILIIKGLFL